jgi:hypothetical protein
MFPKDSCAAGLVSSLVLLGGGGGFKKRGPVGGLQVTGGMSLKDTVGPPLFSSFLLLSGHKEHSKEAKQAWTEIPQTMSPHKPLLFIIDHVRYLS